MPEDRVSNFLQMIRKAERGRLKIYLGYCPGVGKTYLMLQEGRRLKREGIDVVVGVVETHGRAETEALLEGLEVVPRKAQDYHGIKAMEMDLDAVLARRPQAALVDELAHTNVPGSRNAKRYQDIQDLLAAGIHVISTMNVQHLESLYNTVENLVRVKVRERVPDSVLNEADEVVNVDLSEDDLIKRLKDGKIYPRERINTSLENFFKASHLTHLRELTMREMASQIDFKSRENRSASSTAPEQVMACLSSRSEANAALLRYTSRLAGRLNRNWYALYVQTPKEDPLKIDSTVQRKLSDTLTLANQLGAMVFTFKGENVVDTILRFAKEYRVGHIVVGRPTPRPWWRRLLGQASVAEDLVRSAKGVSVVVISPEEAEPEKSPAPEAPAESAAWTPLPEAAPAAPAKLPLADRLSAERIVLWKEKVSHDQILEDLVGAASRASGLDKIAVLQAVKQREEEGSTFLNEGIALPHARLEGLKQPVVALGLTQAGLQANGEAKPFEAVFLMLSPADAENAHLELLSLAGRAFQSPILKSQLRQASTPQDALEEIKTWERLHRGRATQT